MHIKKKHCRLLLLDDYIKKIYFCLCHLSPFLKAYEVLNSITRYSYEQFIYINDRITSSNAFYRMLLRIILYALCATGDMKSAAVSRIGGKSKVREVPTPQPSAEE